MPVPDCTNQQYSYEEARDKATPQQYEFVLKLLVNNFNATAAAIAAGYTEKSAPTTGNKLMRKSHIQALISYEIENRTKRVKYNADNVLYRLMEIDQLDCLDILQDNGDVKPIRDWPKAWRTLISGIEITEVYGSDEDGQQKAIGLLKKIKWPDKLKNLDLLGKHVDVQAWQMPEININFTEELAGRMSKARGRVINGESKPAE